MPVNWGWIHNSLLIILRLYYRGAELDPDFPPPQAAATYVAPRPKPRVRGRAARKVLAPPDEPLPRHDNHHAVAAHATPLTNALLEDRSKRRASDTRDKAAPSSEPLPAAKRQAVLREVREHLELLKEFEGVVRVSMYLPM
jgi:hypothetical protein